MWLHTLCKPNTPPTEGIRISWGWGGGGLCRTKTFKEMYEA